MDETYTYLLAGNRILPISCKKNRSGKDGFLPLLIFFSTYNWQNTCLLKEFETTTTKKQTVCNLFCKGYRPSILKLTSQIG